MYDTNISALSAFGTVQQVVANNIANVNTDEFQSSRTVLESSPNDQGVRVSDIQVNESPGPIIDEVEGSNTDLATEMVTMMTNEAAFDANVAVIRAQEEMTGSLFDMII